MRSYSLTRVPDAVLLRDADAAVSQERGSIAVVVAHIAEIESRRLHVSAGYSSIHDYCVRRLRYSEQAAFKRIRAGRAARRFPKIYDDLAEGRLHLSAVVLLKPHLTTENADELVAAATHKTKAEIEQILARRFPQPDVPARIEAIAPMPCLTLTTEPVAPGTPEAGAAQLSPGTVEAQATTNALAPTPAPAPRPKVKPLSAERFALQFTIGRVSHDRLRNIQALLSHQLPSGDIEQVFDRAIELYERHLEKQKYAATEKPRPSGRRSSGKSRYIPAHVKRAVRERDQDQCTFVSEDGQRCGARRFLELDHILPVARGGQSTVDNIRLHCAAHNQLEAERVYGAGFMTEKREAARRAAADARTRAEAAKERARVEEAEARSRAAEDEARAKAAEAEARAQAIAREQARDVLAGLRELGFRADQARRAAEFSETLQDATLEERMRAALRFLAPKTRAPGGVGTNLWAST